jgi:hypothetical protein
VVCCEGVLCSSVAFATDPAVRCCVSYLLGFASVASCVVGAWGLWVRSVPCGLADGAACAVGGEGAAGQAGLADWHFISHSKWFCMVETMRLAIRCMSHRTWRM